MIPDFHYDKPEYPGADATEEEKEAYFVAMDEYEAKYARWEHENRWKLRGFLALGLILLPPVLILMAWDRLKEFVKVMVKK